jgi:hypothetical protein
MVAFAYQGTLRFGESAMGLEACALVQHAAEGWPEQFSRTIISSFLIDASASLDHRGTSAAELLDQLDAESTAFRLLLHSLRN